MNCKSNSSGNLGSRFGGGVAYIYELEAMQGRAVRFENRKLRNYNKFAIKKTSKYE